MPLKVYDSCVDLNTSNAVSGSSILSAASADPVEPYPKTSFSSDESVILVNFAFSNYTFSLLVSLTFNFINSFTYLTV